MPTPHPSTRTASEPVHLFADCLLALVLFALEAAVLLLFAVASAFSLTQRTPGEIRQGETRMTLVLWAAAAVLAVIGYVLNRSGFVISGMLHALSAVACVVFAFAVMTGGDEGAGPPPSSPVSDHRGPGGQCRSGGDSDECLGG
ncbi:DUF6234 family protein [Streptomyces sp. t39]|uniref:DUF6234 family protein n=1 Tax=Streptomyces sp. t39 TaxID=1828156 RepID=UPI0011CE865C|nr:DUF6234 family protein [Streptomyces sp. t39]TXS58156.1 hypothetical protein EAO77_00610 [Streptomyces sp. t39]